MSKFFCVTLKWCDPRKTSAFQLSSLCLHVCILTRVNLLCCVAVCMAAWPTPHRLLNGAVILADVVDDARDAERTGEAQQVGQEAECDAEDERSAKCFPQGLPDQLWAQGCCALRPLREDKKKRKGGTEVEIYQHAE